MATEEKVKSGVVVVGIVDQTPVVKETLTAVPDGWLGIRETAAQTGYLPQYIRQLLRKGTVPGVKAAIEGGYSKWYVDVSAIKARRTAGRAARTGLRRFALKMDPTFEAQVRQLLDEADITYTLEFANKGKKKAAVATDAADVDVDEDEDVLGLTEDEDEG